MIDYGWSLLTVPPFVSEGLEHACLLKIVKMLTSRIRFSGLHRFKGQQRFKYILGRQLEIYVRACFIGAKFDNSRFFLGSNAGIVDGSRHIAEIPCPRSDSKTYQIATRFYIFGLEVPLRRT